jgi:hypothetical protein
VLPETNILTVNNDIDGDQVKKKKRRSVRKEDMTPQELEERKQRRKSRKSKVPIVQEEEHV